MDDQLPPPPDGSPDAESEMSFPASDPPSYSQPTLGDADSEFEEEGSDSEDDEPTTTEDDGTDTTD